MCWVIYAVSQKTKNDKAGIVRPLRYSNLMFKESVQVMNALGVNDKTPNPTIIMEKESDLKERK